MNAAALGVAATIALTVYGQVVIKWQVGLAGPFPREGSDRLDYAVGLATNPFVISVWIAAAAAAGCWTLALTKLELSRAYPFMSLSFVLVLLLSAAFFDEPLSLWKVTGVALIALGVVVGSQG